MAGRPKAGERDDQKTQFGMWLGLPVSARKDDEKTQKDLAKKLGVREETLSLWAKDPYVKGIAQNAIKILGGNDKLAIINKLVELAKEGSHAHIKTYLEWQGEIGAQTGKPTTPKEITVKYVTDS